MEYNKTLELVILKFLRVRIGQTFTPEELLTEICKVFPVTKEDFDMMLRILFMEELIHVALKPDGKSFEMSKILYITKDGLKLLREKKQ